MDIAAGNRKIKWAWVSVVSNTLLVAFKLAVGFFSGSISIISEAIHSGIDLVAAAIAYASVRASSEPADGKHPFGHGKYENLSGLIESALIVAAGVIIIYEAGKKLVTPSPVMHLELGVAVMLVSAVVNIVVSRILLRVARETDSVALETDGAHLLVDVYTSAGVMAGLIAIRMTGWMYLDPLISIGIAGYITWLGISLSIKSSRDLLDVRLPDEEVGQVEKIICDNTHAISSFHKLATRKSGGHRMMDVHIQVHGGTTVKESHDLATHIEQDIMAKFPGSRVLIHIEPCDDKCTECRMTGCPDDRRRG
jgi:cation diffusion facilitator family transporter